MVASWLPKPSDYFITDYRSPPSFLVTLRFAPIIDVTGFFT